MGLICEYFHVTKIWPFYEVMTRKQELVHPTPSVSLLRKQSYVNLRQI